MHCLVIDRHPVSLMGFRYLLEENFPSWKIFTAASVPEGLQYTKTGLEKHGHVHVVILDLMLCLERGADLLSHIRAMSKHRPIEVLLGDLAFSSTQVCKLLGADAFVARESSQIEIVQILSEACNREEKLPGKSSRSARTIYSSLTNRQRDLVDLLVTGYSNKEIARTLNLSYGTVKNYMFDLMRLLNARSRLELVAKIREGAPTTQSNMPLMVHSPLRHKNGSS